MGGISTLVYKGLYCGFLLPLRIIGPVFTAAHRIYAIIGRIIIKPNAGSVMVKTAQNKQFLRLLLFLFPFEKALVPMAQGLFQTDKRV